MVARAQFEGFNPDQQIAATQLSPALQVCVTDAAVIGINQVEAAMAAAAAVKGVFHCLYTGTELLL